MNNQQKVQNIIIKFKLDQPNFQFDRDGLVNELGALLNDYILEYAIKRENKGKCPYVYPEFKRAVEKVRVVFDAISMVKEVKVKEGLTEGLWGCFFAKYVSTKRERLFPGIHDKIKNRTKVLIK